MYPELKQYVYYAYPSDYDSGCQLDFNSLLSINTKSEQKAGAWAFLSYLLSESYQQSMNYLPVSDTVLFSRQLRANYRVGYWEYIIQHTKPLGIVPADMRAGTKNG